MSNDLKEMKSKAICKAGRISQVESPAGINTLRQESGWHIPDKPGRASVAEEKCRRAEK